MIRVLALALLLTGCDRPLPVADETARVEIAVLIRDLHALEARVRRLEWRQERIQADAQACLEWTKKKGFTP